MLLPQKFDPHQSRTLMRLMFCEGSQPEAQAGSRPTKGGHHFGRRSCEVVQREQRLWFY